MIPLKIVENFHEHVPYVGHSPFTVLFYQFVNHRVNTTLNDVINQFKSNPDLLINIVFFSKSVQYLHDKNCQCALKLHIIDDFQSTLTWFNALQIFLFKVH